MDSNSNVWKIMIAAAADYFPSPPISRFLLPLFFSSSFLPDGGHQVASETLHEVSSSSTAYSQCVKAERPPAPHSHVRLSFPYWLKDKPATSHYFPSAAAVAAGCGDVEAQQRKCLLLAAVKVIQKQRGKLLFHTVL